MCIQITGVLPLSTKVENLKILLEKYDLEFIDNQVIINQLSKDEVYYKVTKFGCDCNTGLGKYEVCNTDVSKKIESLNKSDLDETFINTLRQDIIERIKSCRTDVEKWEHFIKDILIGNNVERVGILLHFYEENCECEKFKIKEVKKFKMNQINTDLLLRLERDILYFFVQ
jgi:hypothetical protein